MYNNTMNTCACGCGQPVKNKWKQGHNPKIKGRTFTDEHKRRISESRTGKCAGPDHPRWGKPLSAENRRKLADANRGKMMTPETRAKISATKLAQYTSTEPRTIHTWLGRNYPKTGICERCGAVGRTDYASINGHVYTRNREDYEEMCPSCHITHDYAEGIRRRDVGGGTH